jgi:predicted chitinase
MADVLTEVQLTAFLPKLPNTARWALALNAAMDRFDITTPARVAAFLAQTAHESAEFRTLVENLSYSAAGLCKNWPNRFATPDVAKPYERNPELLANYVYAKRLGNGDAASGDGWRFRGRGLIQLTGRGNYRSCGLALTLRDDHQDHQRRHQRPHVATELLDAGTESTRHRRRRRGTGVTEEESLLESLLRAAERRARSDATGGAAQASGVHNSRCRRSKRRDRGSCAG